MRWILTTVKLPKRDQEVIIHMHGDYHNCYRAKFDRSNPRILKEDRKKFWVREDKGGFKWPTSQDDVLYWIPFPKYVWEDS